MEAIQIRSFHKNDFDSIQHLNKEEGWDGLVQRGEETLCSLLNSEPALVAVSEDGEVIGYLRGLTDGALTLYVCELLVKEGERSQGIAKRLISTAHECYPDTRVEMLANQQSESYYSNHGYRAFYGFRKSSEEM
ncbi:GNAT family N-acetyltransferase [Halobacillus litoralis]|uniref:GNAT family N-acetyltransferase n=1 Tax=Halobacillus litoralis TaxID=45668 RepID=UPI001CFF30EF|nr:GNAT family N-acetyltransferase [Halobacillus litoralis]